MNRALVYELATARFIAQREDVLLLGPPGTTDRGPVDGLEPVTLRPLDPAW